MCTDMGSKHKWGMLPECTSYFHGGKESGVLICRSTESQEKIKSRKRHAGCRLTNCEH